MLFPERIEHDELAQRKKEWALLGYEARQSDGKWKVLGYSIYLTVTETAGDDTRDQNPIARYIAKERFWKRLELAKEFR